MGLTLLRVTQFHIGRHRPHRHRSTRRRHEAILEQISRSRILRPRVDRSRMTDDIVTTNGGIIPEAVLMRKIIDAMIPVVDELRMGMTITETEEGIATGI